MVNLYKNAESDTKKEIAWALSNAASRATNEQIKYLGSLNYIKPLCDFLVCPDPILVTACLEGLENFLRVGEAEKSSGNTRYANLYTQMIDDVGGLEKIKNLQSHDDKKICEKAVKIIKSFGGSELSVPSGGC
ncbi:importin subunit alpha-1-like [Trifolium medium]|uniref:Importin subunit alpha-1-like n=2 Tax=Trifolium medium TaxID=97028 RepID=A0A392MQ82_9FABA|nr:importin subunit alpha-1-like [Trifolium medium]